MVNHRARGLINNIPRHVCFDILLTAVDVFWRYRSDIIDHKVFVYVCYELRLATDEDEGIFDEKTRSARRSDVVSRAGRQSPVEPR
jgi:hypothetical protein